MPGGPGLDEERLEVSDELLDALLSGARTAEEIAGPDGLLGQLTRRLLNRALEAELTAHLGYEAGEAPPGGAGNARPGPPGAARPFMTSRDSCAAVTSSCGSWRRRACRQGRSSGGALHLDCPLAGAVISARGDRGGGEAARGARRR